MDYEEFKRNIGKAGLSSYEFANLIMMSPNSISNLKMKDKVPKHLAIIALLLGEMKDKKVDFMWLFEDLDITPQKKRKEYFGKQPSI